MYMYNYIMYRWQLGWSLLHTSSQQPSPLQRTKPSTRTIKCTEKAYRTGGLPPGRTRQVLLNNAETHKTVQHLLPDKAKLQATLYLLTPSHTPSLAAKRRAQIMIMCAEMCAHTFGVVMLFKHVCLGVWALEWVCDSVSV